MERERERVARGARTGRVHVDAQHGGLAAAELAHEASRAGLAHERRENRGRLPARQTRATRVLDERALRRVLFSLGQERDVRVTFVCVSKKKKPHTYAACVDSSAVRANGSSSTYDAPRAPAD